jgi:hypothetical protein
VDVKGDTYGATISQHIGRYSELAEPRGYPSSAQGAGRFARASRSLYDNAVYQPECTARQRRDIGSVPGPYGTRSCTFRSSALFDNLMA